MSTEATDCFYEDGEMGIAQLDGTKLSTYEARRILKSLLHNDHHVMLYNNPEQDDSGYSINDQLSDARFPTPDHPLRQQATFIHKMVPLFKKARQIDIWEAPIPKVSITNPDEFETSILENHTRDNPTINIQTQKRGKIKSIGRFVLKDGREKTVFKNRKFKPF
ncbi:MAG TPA: hypothetical protein VMR41_04260 [Patescibacteria group bacterium]|nr:hypothetical protein [Patescibacteria group bacterium]